MSEPLASGGEDGGKCTAVFCFQFRVIKLSFLCLSAEKEDV